MNLKAKTLENIFKVESKFVPMLRDMNVSQLLIVRKYPFLNTFDDINLILNIKDRKYIMKFLNSRMLNFICQNDISISIYNDYLRFCDELGMDMNSSKVLFPIDYKEKHDTLMNQIKVLRSEKQDKLIKEQFDKHKKYAFENSLFIIYPVSSTQQLIDESKELNHCVRTYAEKVAMKQTEIMFVRNVNKKEKPLYTLELKGKK